MPAPDSGSYTYLYAVTARAANDAEAIGGTSVPLGGTMVIAHWNGTTLEPPSPSPSSGSPSNMLTSVKQPDTSDDTSVISYYLSSLRPLYAHWNGSAWNSVPGPTSGAGVDGYLQSVTMVTPNDIWAVGQTYAAHPDSFTVHSTIRPGVRSTAGPLGIKISSIG